MTSMVFVNIGTTVTENTIRLFVERETNVKTIKLVKKGTQKIAEIFEREGFCSYGKDCAYYHQRYLEPSPSSNLCFVPWCIACLL